MEQEMKDFFWTIEAPGQHYITVIKSGGYSFGWTKDHKKALFFYNEEQAFVVMMAVRALQSSLFEFERTLGNARPVEHGWLSHVDRLAPGPDNG